MIASVTRLRPREFYAVVPGASGGPGEGRHEPVFYARTLDGAESALAHAQHLSAGGGIQYITLTEGRQTWIWRTFQNGLNVSSPDPPVIYRTTLFPSHGAVRPGAPHGKIPETSRTAMARKAGRKPRKNPNCPPCQWPGLELT
jgi:hypothetical protein